jgi:hypothetical protein
MSSTDRSPEGDAQLNEQINRILREAAEKREARNRSQSVEDSAEAGRRLEALVTLARAQNRVPRPWPAAPNMPGRRSVDGTATQS